MTGPRWILVALLVSLAANLFVVGALVGMFTIGRQVHQQRIAIVRHAPPRPGLELWRAAEALPPEHARALREHLRGQAGAVGPAGRERQQRRMQVFRDAATAQPFDPAATKAALAALRAEDNAARGGVEDAVIDFAATLPPEERRALFTAMAQRPPRQRVRVPLDGPPPPP